MPLRWTPAHAYTPNEAPLYGGGVHAMALEPVAQGRLKREKSDALCKPRRKFWGLDRVEAHREVTCARCKALLARLEAGPPQPDDPPTKGVPEAEKSPDNPDLTLVDALAKLFPSA